MKQKDYVVGFAISNVTKNNDYNWVLLIKKVKPEWQTGLLNGVGGKIEDYDLSPTDVMVREFKEETNIDSDEEDWNHFLTMNIGEQNNDPDPKVKNSKIYFYYTTKFNHFSDKALSVTEEIVDWFTINEIFKECPTVPNVKWLIPMIIDKLNNPHSFRYATIYY